MSFLAGFKSYICNKKIRFDNTLVKSIPHKKVILVILFALQNVLPYSWPVNLAFCLEKQSAEIYLCTRLLLTCQLVLTWLKFFKKTANPYLFQ